MLQRSYDMTPSTSGKESRRINEAGLGPAQSDKQYSCKGCKPYGIAPWKGELKLAVSYSLCFHSS